MPLMDQIVFLGQSISFNATATDPDIPVQTLSFNLGEDSPAGAAINATNGQFLWTPDAPGTNTIASGVTATGSPEPT